MVVGEVGAVVLINDSRGVCACVCDRERGKLVCLVPVGIEETPNRANLRETFQTSHGLLMVEPRPNLALRIPVCFSVCEQGENTEFA